MFWASRHVGINSVYIFPTSSAKSLTPVNHSWRVDIWWEWINTFVNLTSLCGSPFTNKSSDFIVCSDFRLVDFHLQLTWHSKIAMNKVMDMFSAPSLQNLRHLRFSIDVQPLQRPHISSLLQSIISNPGSLEELCMPLNLSGCKTLGHLMNLKIVLW